MARVEWNARRMSFTTEVGRSVWLNFRWVAFIDGSPVRGHRRSVRLGPTLEGVDYTADWRVAWVVAQSNQTP